LDEPFLGGQFGRGLNAKTANNTSLVLLDSAGLGDAFKWFIIRWLADKLVTDIHLSGHPASKMIPGGVTYRKYAIENLPIFSSEFRGAITRCWVDGYLPPDQKSNASPIFTRTESGITGTSSHLS
jgi:hypothetical protein